jgi:replicative DNA helicase
MRGPIMSAKLLEKDELLEKIPPQNIEAEKSVLGSMLIEKAAIGKAIEILGNEVPFYREVHKKIYLSIVDLFMKNEPVDLVTITEELKRKQELEAIGGVGYLTEMINSVPTAANVEYYAKIVKEKATLRGLINACEEIKHLSYETPDDVDKVVDNAEKIIFSVTQEKIKQDFLSIKHIIKDSFQTIEELYAKKEHVTGIPTGYREFDLKTSGLHGSEFIIIAGRPSMGKTSFALGIAHKAGVEEKTPVAIFSLEMSRDQLVQRMLCSEARVDAQKVRTGYLSESDWPKLTIAAGRLAEAPIFIDDTPAISALEVRAKARRLKAEQDIGLIIIDYLQLMSGSGRSENRQQEISDISRSLKSLARELNVPVVALSQLSRAVEQRPDSRPRLSDLRESGAIEQDADIVVFIFREEVYKPEIPELKGMAQINIGKQRNGPTGPLDLAFIKEYTKFENLTRRTE